MMLINIFIDFQLCAAREFCANKIKMQDDSARLDVENKWEQSVDETILSLRLIRRLVIVVRAFFAAYHVLWWYHYSAGTCKLVLRATKLLLFIIPAMEHKK